jgi:hypothetical protein
MASDDCTDSSLTTEPENLTALLLESGLQVAYETRRTNLGLVVREVNLPGFVPTPPTKRPTTSWVWRHGHAVSFKDDQNNLSPMWLCRLCYTSVVAAKADAKVVPGDDFIFPANPTNIHMRHMETKHHYQSDGTLSTESHKRPKKRTITEAFSAIETAQKRTFDRGAWQTSYTRWITLSGVSLRQATSQEFYNLLTEQDPRLEEVIPRSAGTAHAWIIDAYNNAKSKVIKSIANSTSKLTISFDGWKANNDALDLLGVIVHYLGDDNKLHNVVLAMSDTLGSHTGTNIAEQLFDVLKDYQIHGHQIAYFQADNAFNNDTALAALAERVDIHPVNSRLRCAGHIFNLVCNAILFGVPTKAEMEDARCDFSQPTTDEDDNDEAASTQAAAKFESIMDYGSEAAKHLAWQRRGPIGKLHNLVTNIKASSSRRALFESKQSELIDEDGDTAHAKIYRLVTNGGIRWNSTYLMIARAIQLKDALMLYQTHKDAEIPEDEQLNRHDWEELSDFNLLLEPIHEVSMHVQSVGTTAGALHNTLTSMDYLLTHLETRRNQPGSTHFMTCLNIGWKKLIKYYRKTDLNPAYIMAVFLNPHYRQFWFEEHWTAPFSDAAMVTVKEQFLVAQRLYNIDAPSISPPIQRKEASGFASYNKLRRRHKQHEDELARYMNAPEPPEHQDPLDWWILHQSSYPVLKHLAFTLLAAPASSASDERLFSIAGNFVNEQRPLTQQELAQAEQCLRSWYTEGLI